VRAVSVQPVIQYWLSDKDVAHIKRGMDVLAQVFFAAGARRVHTPINGFDILESAADLAALRRATIRPWDLDLSAYHPLGTARMGSDPASSVLRHDHQMHETEALYEDEFEDEDEDEYEDEGEEFLRGIGRLVRRAAPTLGQQTGARLTQLVNVPEDVRGQPHRPRLFCDRLLHRLAQPPRRVCWKRHPASRIKPSRRAQHPEHALLHQIGHLHVFAGIPARDPQHKRQTPLN